MIVVECEQVLVLTVNRVNTELLVALNQVRGELTFQEPSRFYKTGIMW